MTTVKDIISRKAGTITIASGKTVLDALKIMAEKNIGSVVVVDAQENYLGVVTERDYSRKVILKDKHSTTTLVEEIMTTDLPPVALKDTIDYCREVMTAHNVRYLPVMAANELQGIISMSDVVKETIAMQQQTIHHLQQYINL